MHTFFLNFSRLIAIAAIYLLSAVFAGPAFAQALADGSYRIDGDIDDPADRAPFIGTFTVSGGTIATLSVKFADSILIPATGSTYTGTTIVIESATAISGTLNGAPDEYLTLKSDGRFDCGGGIFNGSDACRLTRLAYGTEPNEKTGSYTISLINTAPTDNIAPIIAVPADQAANADAGASTASLDITGLGAVTDNVDTGLAITYQVGSTVLTGAYDFPIGATVVTMDAADTAGNDAAQVSFTVTVSDAGAPVLTAPADQVATTDAGANTASLDVTGLGTVSDNVDTGLAITYQVGTTLLTGAYDFPIGATVVTMDAADTAGNDATQVSFTVTISDAGAPVLTAPADQVATTDAGANTASLDVTGLGAVTDNFDTGLAITNQVGTTVLTGAYDFLIGATVVTMDAADTAGNDATQVSFTVTVIQTVTDTTAPAVATSTTITTNPDGSITVTGMAEPNAIVEITFPDGSVARAGLSATGSFSVTSGAAQLSGNV
ncbi:HYR domain-containing protein [Yoonia sp. MH D7]